jgi:hypothetical protein
MEKLADRVMVWRTVDQNHPSLKLQPIKATRARILELHRKGLIELALQEDDPPGTAGAPTDRAIAGDDIEKPVSTAFIMVLVGQTVGRPSTHPLRETFIVIDHPEKRDPWYLYGFDHTRVGPVLSELPELKGKNWTDLSPEKKQAVMAANKARFGRGEVVPEDMFCLEFGDGVAAELKDYVSWSMPTTTIHGEVCLPSETGRYGRFLVSEVHYQVRPPKVWPGPTHFSLAGPARN